MRKTSTTLLTALLLRLVVSGQDMHLLSGSMTVQSGTTMRLEGPINWTLEPGSAVTNDGVIDLGEEAVLVEPINGPVTGVGMELARVAAIPGSFAVEPGGLGLELIPNTTIGALAVERHHTPLLLPEGDASIARWFRIESAASPGNALALVLRYDPTELNGISPDALGIFEAPDAMGPWAGLATVNSTGTRTLAATDQSPWALITAFDANAPTGASTMVAEAGFRAWPTLVVDQMYLTTTGDPLQRLEVFDAVGRLVLTQGLPTSTGTVTLQLSALTPGSYYLRMNERHVIKFRKA